MLRSASQRNLWLIPLLVTAFLICLPAIGVVGITHPSSAPKASALSDVTSYPGDLYDWGNCTWWAAMRRAQIGDPIPNTWGNAATWASRAAAGGYLVDQTPSHGAIMQISNVDGGLGHVAFVESVDSDGTWHISEMNVLGLDVVDYKAMPATAAYSYNFIHDRQ